jgi:cytochrome c556
MTLISRFFGLAALLVLLSACEGAAPPDTFPGQPVTQRNQLFKQMLRSFEPLGLMVREKEPFKADEAIRLAGEVKRLSTLPWQHFPAGSDYRPSKSKPEVWARPDDFKKAQNEFIVLVDALELATRSRTADKIKPAYEAVVQSCSDCHKAFRVK